MRKNILNRMGRGLRRRQDAFTLIETILTLAILGMVLILAVSSVRLGISSWNKGESVTEVESSRRFLFQRMYRDIGSMYPYMKRQGKVKQLVFTGNANDLGFVTAGIRSGSGLPSGGIQWIYYSAGEKGLTVREKIVPSTGLTADTGGVLIELDHTVTGLSFEYSDAKTWTNNWNANTRMGLPVKIRATFYFVGDTKPFEMVIPVNISRVRL